MKRFTFTFAALLATLSFVFVSIASASLQTTNIDLGVSAPQPGPPTGPPLPHIIQISTTQSNSGAFTNQTSGVALVSGGLNTVVAAKLEAALDGFNFSPLTGPGGGSVFAFAALQGTLTAGVADFNPAGGQGVLIIRELSPAASLLFDNRDPSTWSGGTTLGTYPLATAQNVGPSALGFGLLPVPAGVQNKSALTPIIPGNATGSLLFEEVTDNAFTQHYQTLTGYVDTGFVTVQLSQTVNANAVGITVPGRPALDGTDLAVLDSFMALLTTPSTFAAAPGSPVQVLPPISTWVRRKVTFSPPSPRRPIPWLTLVCRNRRHFWFGLGFLWLPLRRSGAVAMLPRVSLDY